MKHPNNSPASCKQVHILGVGLAVHEKLVHPEMRPLHKKLVDQFHMMRTGLHHVRILLQFIPFYSLFCSSFVANLPRIKCTRDRCKYSEQYMVGSQQGVTTMDRFAPAGCQGVNSSRGILSSHSHMSPESVRLIHRHRSVGWSLFPTTST